MVGRCHCDLEKVLPHLEKAIGYIRKRPGETNISYNVSYYATALPFSCPMIL